ncbi:hypothetical protein TNCV_414731 [Trichonephila clavipes]|nr:hypothetical protein TNCV_414731 [Trichonephila clavipes]
MLKPSVRILLLKSETKIESFCWLLESEDNGSEKMTAPLGVLVGILVVRTSDSRPEDKGSMHDATKYPPSTHVVRVR